MFLIPLFLFVRMGVSSTANCTLSSYDQPVDHFADSAVWTQSYYACLSGGGPIFFYPGASSSIDQLNDEVNTTGFMWEFGIEVGATLVFAQHRSFPDDMSQILSDFAHLIAYLQGKRSTTVVTFGSGYSGRLAGWLRMKYPHLVEGALASSVPLLVPQTPLYSSLFAKTFANATGPLCFERLQHTLAVLGSNPKSVALKSAWKLTNYEDILLWATVPWSYLATQGEPLTNACATLTRPSTDDSTPALLRSLAESLSPWISQQRETKVWTCADWTAARALLGVSTWSKISANMPTCTTPDPVEFGNAVLDTIAGMSNIVWSNGELDPWNLYGVHCKETDSTETSSYDCPLSVLSPTIQGVSFGSDLKFANPLDSSDLISTRRLETAHISSWIEARTLRYAKVEPQNPHANLPNVNIVLAN